eukprot:tig00000448_g836.t1
MADREREHPPAGARTSGREELERLAARARAARAEAAAAAQPPKKKLTGVCFSGGGIRSASFCSGVLCWLASSNLLPHVDYISGVSGGGFVACSFADWAVHNPGDVRTWIGAYMANFERNCGYMLDFSSPGRGALDLVVFVFFLLLFLAVVMLTVVPYAIPVGYTLGWAFEGVLWQEVDSELVLDETVWTTDETRSLRMLAVLAGALLAVLLARGLFTPARRANVRAVLACAAFLVALTTGIYVLLLLSAHLGETQVDDYLTIALMGLMLLPAIAPGMFSSNKTDLIVFAFLIVLYGKIANVIVNSDSDDFLDNVLGSEAWRALHFAAAAVIVANPLLDALKHRLMHWFYRWRLQRAFFFKRALLGFGGTRLADARHLPFELISCASANLWRVKARTLWRSSTREWDVFTQVPDTEASRPAPPRPAPPRRAPPGPSPHGARQRLTIADACSISAAVVSANMGTYTRSDVRPVLVLLGLGLGRWVRTARWSPLQALAWGLNMAAFAPFLVAAFTFPRHIWVNLLVVPALALLLLLVRGAPRELGLHLSGLPMVQLVRQVFGFSFRTFGAGRVPSHVFLSDGGHAENLGLLPLLARRCERLLCVDAGFDPDTHCTSFLACLEEARQRYGCSFFPGNPARRKMREEFLVDFRRRFQEPDPRAGPAPRSHQFFVRYADGTVGQILYLKTRPLEPPARWLEPAPGLGPGDVGPTGALLRRRPRPPPADHRARLPSDFLPRRRAGQLRPRPLLGGLGLGSPGGGSCRRRRPHGGRGAGPPPPLVGAPVPEPRPGPPPRHLPAPAAPARRRRGGRLQPAAGGVRESEGREEEEGASPGGSRVVGGRLAGHRPGPRLALGPRPARSASWGWLALP